MVDVGDRLCNLECLQKGPQVHEFIGPVKIILVDPPKKQYCYRTWFAGSLSFANALLTVNFFIIFFHTIQFKSKFVASGHIYLCTLGFQYFMFIGTLLINGLFGPAMPMRRSHRSCQHLVVELAAILSGAGGFFIVYLYSSTSLFSSVHSIIGVVTFGLAVLSAIAGPAAHFIKEGLLSKIFKGQHNLFGTLAAIMSSTCFILGLIKPTFKDLLPFDHLYIFMIVFCVVYTLIVSLSPAMKFTDANM